jgi:hypothetical protein
MGFKDKVEGDSKLNEIFGNWRGNQKVTDPRFIKKMLKQIEAQEKNLFAMIQTLSSTQQILASYKGQHGSANTDVLSQGQQSANQLASALQEAKTILWDIQIGVEQGQIQPPA